MTFLTHCYTNLSIGNIDYESGPYDVKLPADITKFTFSIPIKDDEILETTESFRLTIVQTSYSRVFPLFQNFETTVFIVDDDKKSKDSYHFVYLQLLLIFVK